MRGENRIYLALLNVQCRDEPFTSPRGSYRSHYNNPGGK